MADDDASGRFDKQNERGGETSAEGKGAECSSWCEKDARSQNVVLGRERRTLRARIICIAYVCTCDEERWRKWYHVGKKRCVLKGSEIHFSLEKPGWNLHSVRNKSLSSMEGGELAHKRKWSRFLFSHAKRKWSFACFNSISLWGAPLWPSFWVGWGFSPAEKMIPICCSYFSAFVEIFPLLL